MLKPDYATSFRPYNFMLVVNFTLTISLWSTAVSTWIYFFRMGAFFPDDFPFSLVFNISGAAGSIAMLIILLRNLRYPRLNRLWWRVALIALWGRMWDESSVFIAHPERFVRTTLSFFDAVQRLAVISLLASTVLAIVQILVSCVKVRNE